MTQTIVADVVSVVDAANHLGETPVWSQTEQSLYWINVEREPELHRWSPVTGDHRQWPMPERIGGVVLKQDGGVLVVLSSGLHDLDSNSGKLRLRVASPLPAHVTLHECVTDRQGRLWVGAYDRRFSPEQRHHNGGAYFRLDGDQLVPVIEGITVANGLAFSPDGRTMYAADSALRRVDACDVDIASGALSNRRVFLTLPVGVGYLDGAAVDDEGGYWLALMYGSALHRYLPDGRLDRILPLPFSSPTKAIFGGADLDTLFITTTRMQLGPNKPAGFDNNGGVYACRPGFRGVSDALLVD